MRSVGNMRSLLFGLICLLVFPSFAQSAVAPPPGQPSVQAAARHDDTVPGPIAGMKVTEAYVRLAARQTYFWGWPIADIYNRRSVFSSLKEPVLMGGAGPAAPLNRMAMLSDYIDPRERMVACPNQDVVYGAGVLALDISPVVVQVPDFGTRFWVYQAVDVRADSFAELGAMYGTKPGFYLIVGPDWKGETPKGITQVFRCPTNTAMLIPRIFQDDTPEDKKAVQAVIRGIDAYPLAEFTGTAKTRDWSKIPSTEASPQAGGQSGETKWVDPERFFDELPALLKDAPPLPGEEALYQQMRFLAETAKNDPNLRKAMTEEAVKADQDLIAPLLEFRTFGLALPHHWGTITNGAAFGTDYFTRTAVARSNILVNKENETKYFYQDLDKDGARLNGANRYTVTFPKGGIPVKGFWSLTLYNEQHFFVINPLNRYSIGTKSPNLKYNDDGSLTLYVQATPPGADKEANWLPAPADANFSLYIRAYWPTEAVLQGQWLPPEVIRQ